jgi:nitroreductase
MSEGGPDKQETAFHTLSSPTLTTEEQLSRSQGFLATMRTRRSVRQFSSQPVPFALVERAIEAAGSAPSGANQQPWQFVVVSNPSVKARIRQAAEAEERESYEHRMSAEWLTALEPLGTDWHKPHLEQAPYLIVVFEQVTGVVADEGGKLRKVRHYYPKESVGIAVGFLLTALHHAGLATLVHTPSPMKFLGAILNRPQNERAFAIIPVGYPAADVRMPALHKKRLAEIMVHID